MNDDFLFADDDDDDIPQMLGTWKVLIVDDEPEIHAVTKLALSDFELHGRGLSFLSAYSAEEAIEIFKQHDDIAVVLLDVVMETDDAGLRVANVIRNDLDNHFTRIILRTGQPGQAPEKHVIVNYDINDYKSKTELTAQKLFTVIIASLRSYRDIITIEENRAGLEKVVQASTDLFSCRSLEKFVQGLIQQLSSVLCCTEGAAYITTAVASPKTLDSVNTNEMFIFAGNGDYDKKRGMILSEAFKNEQYVSCCDAIENRSIVFGEDHIAAYCGGSQSQGAILYLSGLHRKVTENDKMLVKLFADNVQVAYENVMYLRETRSTQNELVERLCKAMDYSDPSDNHISRIVAITECIACHLDMPKVQRDRLCAAVPLHDIGNSRLPETLLKRNGPLTEQEKRAIQDHANLGANILAESKNETVQLAASLARQHHERWDGSGYPFGLKGEAIGLESRIVAAADVFDALFNERIYKKAWPIDDVIAFFKSQSGQIFDPEVAKSVIACQSELVEIQTSKPDGKPIFSQPE